jgi:hypothetical protein
LHSSEGKAAEDLIIDWSLTHFLEKWMWLIGFFFVASSAFSWGRQRQEAAVQKETETNALDRLRMAALIDGNEPARNQLAGKIKSINEQRTNDQATVEGFKQRPRSTRYRQHVGHFFSQLWHHKIGAAGFVILTALPLLSKGFTIGHFNFGRAQARAWEALDSSFAEAFSLIAIAIVFFAGSQLRRLHEAIQKYEIATEKASWAQAQLTSARDRKAREDYVRAVRDLRGLSFTPPAQSSRSARAIKLEADGNAFVVVVEAAKSLAVGDNPVTPTTSTKDIETQTLIIDQIASASQSGFWSLSWKSPFAKFLDAVLQKRPELSERFDYEIWKKLAANLNISDGWAIIRQLAQQLTKERKARTEASNTGG